MLTEKELPIQEMQKSIEEIISDRVAMREIKLHLGKHGISAGRVEQVLSNLSILENEETDIREAILFVEQFFINTKRKELDPENWWTPYEMKEARQYYPLRDEELYKFPYVIENVSMIKHNVWSVVLDVRTIAKWMETMALSYNYEIQRQSTIKVRRNMVIERPTVFPKNVEEIKNLMNTGELGVTTLAFNAALGTADEGDELEYGTKKRTLTINEGSRIDILDGFHRCLASLEAYNMNQDIDFRFNVLFSSYSTPEARQYQAQLAKATPLPKSRIDELGAEILAATTIQQLRANSDLRGKVSSNDRPERAAGELVSHKVLLEAIDKEFPMSTRAEAYEVADWLGVYFDILIGRNQAEFLGKGKSSLMSIGQMFVGYVALAAEMKERGVNPSKIHSIIQQVDFSRENKLWRDIGLLNDKLTISGKLNEKMLSDYFRKLDM